MTKEESISKFFISFTNVNKKVLSQSNMKLKYDYKDINVLESIIDLSKCDIPKRFQLTERQSKLSFMDALSLVLLDMDNESVYNYFALVSRIVNFDKKKGLDILDSKVRIIMNDDDIHFDVTVPDRPFDTDLCCAMIGHELSHFSMFLGKSRKDIFEYSEALSMFFESMIYSKINEDNLDSFINNRLSMLRLTLDDLNEDVMYASNPSQLAIDSKYYALPLAYNLSYPESLEYVLQLFDCRSEDKTYVDDLIGDMLLGYKGTDEVGKLLDIDTSGYKKIRQLIK